jgi:hypothetical protein
MMILIRLLLVVGMVSWWRWKWCATHKMVIMISIFSKHGPNPDPKQTDKQGHDDHHQQGCDQANPSFRYLLLLLLLLPYSLLVMLFSRSTSDDGRRRR